LSDPGRQAPRVGPFGVSRQLSLLSAMPSTSISVISCEVVVVGRIEDVVVVGRIEVVVDVVLTDVVVVLGRLVVVVGRIDDVVVVVG
jgi:hypothetical protein